jgi:hypothetical protein
MGTKISYPVDTPPPHGKPARTQGCTAPPPWYGLVVALVVLTACVAAVWLVLK